MADATDSLWAEISELAKDPSITTSPPAKPKKLPYNDKMRERLTLLSKYLEDVQGDFDDVALMPEWQQARDVIVRLQAYFVARKQVFSRSARSEAGQASFENLALAYEAALQAARS